MTDQNSQASGINSELASATDAELADALRGFADGQDDILGLMLTEAAKRLDTLAAMSAVVNDARCFMNSHGASEYGAALRYSLARLAEAQKP